MKGHSTGYLATTTTDKQGHKKKKKYRKMSQTKGNQEVMIFNFTVTPWFISLKRKRTLMEKLVKYKLSMKFC